MSGLYHAGFLDYLDVVGEPDPAGVLGGVTAGSGLMLRSLVVVIGEFAQCRGHGLGRSTSTSSASIGSPASAPLLWGWG
jgi:hypothetical protein